MDDQDQELTEFVWGAEFSISNEYGELWFTQADGSGTVSGLLSEDELEISSIEWVLNQNPEIDRAMVEVLSFTWSSARFENSH